MDQNRLEELAILQSLGALTEQEEAEYEMLLANTGADEREGLSKFDDVAALMGAEKFPLKQPPAHLKESLMGKICQREFIEESQSTIVPEMLSYLRNPAASGDWQALKVPGAFAKPLSIDRERGFAVVLGKIEAGVRYPAHKHPGSEDLFILTGDLHIGDKKLEAGDFHHAEAGSSHDVNWSEKGCTLLAVIALENLAEMMP